jgi:heme oxygenase (mycobilin-producing)
MRREGSPGGAAEVFVFISHLTVPDGDHETLERHFRDRSRLVDDFPGFLYLQLLRPQAGDATHTFLTAWESRDAFRRYMASQEHAISHGREPGEIMARTGVRHEAYEVLMDSRHDPEHDPAHDPEHDPDGGH